MDENEHANLYSQGFLQGPQETDSEFARRIKITKEIAQNPHKLGLKDVQVGKKIGSFDLSWLLYKISNEKLPPWEGAAVFTIEYEGIKIPYLQLRKRYANNEEIWNHELVHILRIAYDEPKFEEIMAFDRSKASWRKYLGPLFRTPKESLIFLLSTFGFALLSIWNEWALLAPLFVLLGFSIRLWRDLKIFSKFKKQLRPDDRLYSYTDKDIAKSEK